MRKQDLLLGAAQGPACRVVGRVDDQQAGSGCHRRQQFVHVELPAACHRLEADATHYRAHDGWLRSQVGPDRCDRHDLVAGINHRLHRQHQGIDAARGNRNPVGPDGRSALAAQAVAISGNGFTEFRQPEVVSVKGLAFAERARSRLADKGRRDLIALAKPELEHIAAPHAGIGDLADQGLFEIEDNLSHSRPLSSALRGAPFCRCAAARHALRRWF